MNPALHARVPRRHVLRPPRALPPGRWIALALAAGLALGLAPRAVADAAHAGHHDAAMSDEAMKASADAYWATHRAMGASPGSTGRAAAATFTVGNFLFDNGGAAQVDTARILVGESVTWQWVAGFHTITSGTGSTDPNAGVLFNQPSDLDHPQFTFSYAAEGTYPFFCAFHELQNMRGVVVVSTTTAVGPAAGGRTLGFTRDPAPNPSRTGFRFEYTLTAPGRAVAEVFDPGGRRVAVILDRELAAGAYAAAWNGRAEAGAARAGVYYIRLRLPGYDQSRLVVLRN